MKLYQVMFTLYHVNSTGTLEVILDRRLNQDDNRGVGQGVLDNKLTPANFRLFVEKFQSAPDESLTGVPLTYHSLASNTISQHLSHPVSVLHHSDTDPPPLLSQFVGLTLPLPCDMFVVNLRTIQKGLDPEPTDKAALLLRRFGYDCSFPSWCKTTMGRVSHSRGLFTLFVISTVLSLFDGCERAKQSEMFRLGILHSNHFLLIHSFTSLRRREWFTPLSLLLVTDVNEGLLTNVLSP